MTRSEQQALAETILTEAMGRFPLPQTPALVWRAMPVSAGRATFQTWTITLSTRLLTDEERLRTTLLHEYAHLLAYARHEMAGRGHGTAWRSAMADLGLPPEIHHQYPVKRNRRLVQVRYVCTRCSFELIRSRRFRRGAKYVHVDCGGRFKFHDIRDATDCMPRA